MKADVWLQKDMAEQRARKEAMTTRSLGETRAMVQDQVLGHSLQDLSKA